MMQNSQFGFVPTCKYGLQVHLNYSEMPNSCLMFGGDL